LGHVLCVCAVVRFCRLRLALPDIFSSYLTHISTTFHVK
jgi:hypothetical protein